MIWLPILILIRSVKQRFHFLVTVPELFANLEFDKTNEDRLPLFKNSSLVIALEVIHIFHFINKYLLLHCCYFSIGIIEGFPLLLHSRYWKSSSIWLSFFFQLWVWIYSYNFVFFTLCLSHPIESFQSSVVPGSFCLCFVKLQFSIQYSQDMLSISLTYP